MKTTLKMRTRGFTLIETVIAIGVLAVLVAAFFAVFFPATEGIRRSLSIQEADRLSSALEQGMSHFRQNEQVDGQVAKSGFEKAFLMILNHSKAPLEPIVPDKPIFVYSYRAKNAEDPQTKARVSKNVLESKDLPGGGYANVSVMRSFALQSDQDLMKVELGISPKASSAVEGRIYMVRLFPMSLQAQGAQRVLKEYSGDGIRAMDDADANVYKNPEEYPDAVVPYVAKFYEIPTSDPKVFEDVNILKNIIKNGKPIFTRNMAVRR